MNSGVPAATKVPATPLPAAQTGVGNWREHSLRPVMIAALVLTPLAVIPAILSNQGLVVSVVLLSAYFGLGILTLMPVAYRPRLAGLLGIIYVLGVAELVATGILGNAVFFFLALVLIASMMLSPRGGALTTVLVFFTILIGAWLLQTGRMPLLNRLAMPAKPSDWISIGTTTFLFSSVIVLGFRQLERELGRALSRSHSGRRPIGNRARIA